MRAGNRNALGLQAWCLPTKEHVSMRGSPWACVEACEHAWKPEEDSGCLTLTTGPLSEPVRLAAMTHTSSLTASGGLPTVDIMCLSWPLRCCCLWFISLSFFPPVLPYMDELIYSRIWWPEASFCLSWKNYNRDIIFNMILPFRFSAVCSLRFLTCWWAMCFVYV